MKLYITDEGDPSVGILSQNYTVEAPLTLENHFPDDFEWFKRQMANLYNQFAEGRLTLWYEHEEDDWDIPDQSSHVMTFKRDVDEEVSIMNNEDFIGTDLFEW